MKISRLRLLEERERLEGSLIKFFEAAWPSVDPAPYVGNWHLDAIAEHLQAVSEGKIQKLLINVPPRHSKTLLTSVAWPAWIWAQEYDPAFPLMGPQVKFLCLSYGTQLAMDNATTARRLIASPWYQQRWGKRFQITDDQDAKNKFDTSKSGTRISSSIGGGLLGRGGDIKIIDDPHKVDETESDVMRQGVIREYDETLKSRMTDPKHTAEVIIMQRLHQNDLSGHVLAEKGDFVHLMLPAEFEPARKCTTVLGWTDPRTKDGELLWPDRFGDKQLQPFRKNQYTWAGQWQQRPEPRGGAIFKRDWWNNWNDETAKKFGVKPGFLPSFAYVLGILDTAYTANEERDPSAMTVLGLFHDAQGNPNVLLVNAFEEWLEFPDLAPRVIKVAQATRIDRLLIEAKSAGLSIAQELQRQAGHLGFAVETVDPGKSDKVARAHAQTYAFEDGLMWAPGYEDGTYRKFATKVIDQMAMFPRAEHDDLCFVAGTIIATRRGPIAIEKVRVGDEVVTPFGWRRVTAAACTGIRPVVGRGPLVGTGNHPVFSMGDGYIPLANVSPETKFGRLSLCGLMQATHPRQLSLMASFSGSWAPGNIISASPNPTQGAAKPRGFMWQSGNSITALFPRIMKSIIGTVTRSIAALTIWSAYRKACIAACVRSIWTERRDDSSWMRRDPSPWNGTSLTQAARGIVSMPRQVWATLATHLSEILDTKLCLVLANAHGAEQRFNTATTRTYFAHQSARSSAADMSEGATSFSTRMQPVFNLTVEGSHCYYANGVLVHNCDTVVMGLKYFREYGLLVRHEEHSRSISERLQFRGRQKKLYDV